MNRHVHSHVTLFFAMLVLLSSCRPAQTEVPELLDPPGVSMDTAIASFQDLSKNQYYLGFLAPEARELSFSMEGVLQSLEVSYGDEVHEGDVLARLDTETLAEEIRILQEDIEQQKQIDALTLEQKDLEIKMRESVLNELYSAGVGWSGRRMAALDVEEAELGRKQTEESGKLNLQHMEDQLTRLKSSLEQAVIVSPCDGHVVYIDPQAAAGTSVSAYVPLLGVTDDSTLYAVTEEIPDAVLDGVLTARIGGKDYSVIPAPYSEKERLRQKLEEDVEPKSRFLVESGEERLVAGDTVVMTAQTASREHVLAIPASALHKDSSGSYVYTVEDERRVRKEVSTGLITETMAEITEGLSEGEVVYVQEQQGAAEHVTVERDDYTVWSRSGATVVYPVRAELSWEKEEERFEDILVQKGDRVTEGSALITFSKEENDIEIEEMEIALLRLRENFATECALREDEISLTERRSWSLTSYAYEQVNLEKQCQEKALARYICETEYQIKRQEENLAKAKEKAEEATLMAPYDGLVGDVDASVRPGDSAKTDIPLVTLQKASSAVLRASAGPDAYYYGQAVTVQVEGQTIAGRVVSAGNVYPVDAALIALDDVSSIDLSQAGYTVQISGEKIHVSDALVVDKRAVALDGGNYYVQIVDDTGATHRRRVVLGSENNNGNGEVVWILEGVQEGDTLALFK